MQLLKIFLTTLLFILLNVPTNSQDFQSPCPSFFIYTGQSNQTNGWYGMITLLNDVDLLDIWLRVTFDRPSLRLENSFGETETSDGKEYIIEKPDFKLKANVPYRFSFFLKYNSNEPAPQLVSLILNGKSVCPENKPVGSKKDSQADINSSRDYICGTVIPQPRPLITYGEIISHEWAFPWHAALYHAEGKKLTYSCGATLISNQYVITVAHCVMERKSRTPLNPDKLKIYLGKYYLEEFSNIGIQEKNVSRVTPHPEYNEKTLKDNIALIKFTTAVDITDYVRPVCLWQESPDLTTVLNKLGTVVGWGYDETGNLTEQLMQAKMPVVSHETCIYSFPEFYSRYSSDNMYCAGFRNGTSVCNGDSGGGMVFPKPESDPTNPVWQLRGLVSISVSLKDQLKCDTSHYIVFTDAAKYLDWIKKVMANKEIYYPVDSVHLRRSRQSGY